MSLKVFEPANKNPENSYPDGYPENKNDFILSIEK